MMDIYLQIRPLVSPHLKYSQSSTFSSLPLALYSSPSSSFPQNLAPDRIKNSSQATPNSLTFCLSVISPLVFDKLRSSTGERHTKIGGFFCAARRKKKLHSPEEEAREDAAMEAALEQLFSQLESDLEKGELSGEESSDTITEKELIAFEQDLDNALAMKDGKELPEAPIFKQQKQVATKAGLGSRRKSGHLDTKKNAREVRTISKKVAVVNPDPPPIDTADILESGEDDTEEDEESELEERIVKLEKWQLKKLATAAETGRRRVNIKSLAAEVGLDRSDVLSFLREPPPELLMAVFDEEPKMSETSTSETTSMTSKNAVNVAPAAPNGKKKGPQISKSRSWYDEKRLRKEVLMTLERVYRQTRRPSGALIQNIVELTHVPKKRILQWFEDRRGERVPKIDMSDKLSG